ncbi:hypothetical protein OIU85_015876 [Salix viminalis]|uniref:Uncharacterized protein n=1 Tax=Salix viminalis TaxID=40686 RepID=A0A9Q0ZP46_SALVM|nr:hypothetical protein OIU85_015876 [Salix viminalis]
MNPSSQCSQRCAPVHGTTDLVATPVVLYNQGRGVVEFVIISYRDLSLLNLQGKRRAFLRRDGGVYFHSLWARVVEVCREEVVLKARHENEAFKSQEYRGVW